MRDSADHGAVPPSGTHLDGGTASVGDASVGWARLEWALVAFAFLIHVFLLRHHVYGDAYTRYETLRLLVEEGRVSDARYSIVQSLMALPLFLLGKAIGTPRVACGYFSVFVFWTTLAVVWRLLRPHVEPGLLRRLCLLLATASMFPHHIQTFYGETLGASCVLIGIALLAREQPIAAGVAMVVAVTNAPPTVVALGACNLVWAIHTRRWVHAAWPPALGMLLVIVEMVVRRGLPLRTGYEGDAGFVTLLPYSGQPGFSYPLWLGVLSLLFSFGKGLTWFAPGLWLHYARSGREPRAITSRIEALGMAYAWGLLFVYASWWSWYGGWFWGPRFLLFASVPACLALARHLDAPSPSVALRLLALAALVWSGWVGVNGAVYGQHAMQGCQAKNFEFEWVCWYVPEYSALFRPFVVGRSLVVGEWIVVLHVTAVVLALATSHVRAVASGVVRLLGTLLVPRAR
jgi:hypothetical protein